MEWREGVFLESASGCFINDESWNGALSVNHMIWSRGMMEGMLDGLWEGEMDGGREGGEEIGRASCRERV